MRFVCDNLAVIFVAALTSLLAWLYGGTRTDVIVTSVPWMLLFMFELILVFPQKARGETTGDARERVWSAMKKDPLVWTALGFLALMAIPFANNGLCVNCDRDLIALGHSPEPPVGFIPFCVDRHLHLGVFLWFAAALTGMIATKHCLRRRGKRLMLGMVVWNGFALAILGFVQAATGAEGPLWQKIANVANAKDFFSTFGYPNMAGDYFTSLFAISIALWRRSVDDAAYERRSNSADMKKSAHGMFWRKHLYLVPAAIMFFAAVNTLSRAAIMLVTLLLAVAFLHAFISFTHPLKRSERVRRGTIALGCVALVAFFAIASLPDDVQREVDTIDATEVLTRVTGKGQYHVRVATAIWKDHLLFGIGGWGYKHFCVPYMTPDEYKQLQVVGGINVHNDYLQFLAEHGIVGVGALLAMLLMLLAPVGASWKSLAAAARFVDAKKAPPKPTALFALPAPAFMILAGVTATFIHSFGDCPLRSPAVLTLLFVSLAAIPGFLPKKETE